MRSSILLLIFVLTLAAFCVQAENSGNTYVPDYPGKASIIVEASNTPRYGLKPAEASAFHASLGRFRDLLLAQPVFHPTVGMFVEGYVRADGGGTVVKTEPVRGHGRILYYPYVLNPKTKQTFRMIASDWVIEVFINNPLGALGMSGKYFYEPKPAGQLGGFPVYRDDRLNEAIILSTSGKPLWSPLTREEYLRICIEEIEKQIANEKAEMAKNRANLSPAQLAILSPKDRAEIEKLLSDNPAASMFEQKLKLHQDALARMSPEERAMQAQYGDPGNSNPLSPQLAEIGKRGIGSPYVKVNSNWFDPSRPRSDIQLIIVKCWYGGMNPDHPAIDEWGNVANLRIWETLHTSDWKAIGAALSK
jgi:hypothetical protein